MGQFFKSKISLRFHIFIAIFIILTTSFSIIGSGVRQQAYRHIEDLVSEAINRTRKTLNLAVLENTKRQLIIWSPKTQEAFTITDESARLTADIMTQVYVSRSDPAISLILTNENYDLLWPQPSNVNTIISEASYARSNRIIRYLERNQVDVETSTITSLRDIDEEYREEQFYIQNVPYNTENMNYPENTKYKVILVYNTTNFMRFFDNILYSLLITMLLALFLAAIMTLLISNSIISSIQKLAKFAGRVGKGKYEPHNFSFIDKEIDSLAEDMNTMAIRINKASEEQQVFFQNASHELRTPLMSIQGYAEGLKYKVFEIDDATDIIVAETERLTGMVENLLSISRMDMAFAGKETISKSPADIRELAASAAEKMQGAALRANKNFTLDFTDEDVIVLANETDLFRAIENILSNGLRYAKSDIHIRIEKVENKNAVIYISDDGIGISPDLLPHIFDRFSKGDGGKHGIGLALVRAIVQEHSGTIIASNNPESGGALFTITLPLIPAK